MCGIAGIASTNPKEARELRERITGRMLDVMKHRGPDGRGIHSDGPVTLGHVRLSIIDPAGGMQPVSNEDGSLWLVQNGEIVNFRDLRTELSAKGHVFRTRSDAEVILHLYEEEGTEAWGRLGGFFAFALYDRKKKKLFLVRDRLGVKPLYYFANSNGLAFASTIPALKQHVQFPEKTDEQALWDFLTLQYVPRGTIYTHVRKLPPGCFAEFNPGNNAFTAVKTYWKADYSRKTEISYADACEELRRKVIRAVEKRLIADVPLGTFLSGGLDSTIVSGIAAELTGGPLKGFSIGFEDPAYDERDQAIVNAAHIRTLSRYGFEHKIKVVSPCNFHLLKTLAGEMGEPYADASMLPTSLLSSFAGEEVKAALSGDGADELFGGYERYLAMRYLAQFDRMPGFVRERLVPFILRNLPHIGGERGMAERGRRFLRGVCACGKERYFSIISHTSEGDKRILAGPAFQDVLPTSELFDDGHIFTGGGSASDVRELPSEFDVKNYLPNDTLVKADLASMSASIEVRSPFLDSEVVEFALSLPYEYKEKNGMRKRILCDAFRKYLPEGLARRRKKGFGVPVASWLRNEWKEPALDLLLHGNSVRNGFFSPKGIIRLFESHVSGRADHSYLLFSALMAELCLFSDK